MLLLLPVQAFAADQTGSIQLTMSYDGKSVPGGKVTLYDVTEFHSITDVDEVSTCVRKSGLSGLSREVGADGTVTFRDLLPGYYLLVQEESPIGYLPIKAFCISLPMAVGDELEYHIVAVPKLEMVPEGNLPQTGQLIWPIWILLASGVSLLTLGFALYRKK